MKDINSILDNIIRRLLMTPQSTPRESLYIETGLMDPETISKKQKVLLNYKLENSDQDRNRRIAGNDNSHWKKKYGPVKQALNIRDEDTTGRISTVKQKIRKITRQYFKQKNHNR
jgi:hypothetical protein